MLPIVAALIGGVVATALSDDNKVVINYDSYFNTQMATTYNPDAEQYSAWTRWCRKRGFSWQTEYSNGRLRRAYVVA